ncbi:MarR family transcriptional regulator [Phaeobacter gallaeciensis]|uniref:MarR family transcriptional regulator n=2 Tax=Phaeobacter gallaeciensis TaxID=60890 RepID=A0A1B0ZTQ9_9RHOB|nr:ROK family transcriptional regulator [Phaeobacter gallaeciensis]MDF1774095.1 ROK family transcriptional regulator [Pseudophaeobacter sp. bin_em_oilr2.035]ANP37572.1 MarR family transcriptional regulator [Phaeobacter gallaeciensis]MDE4059818.1 ROK family transcriptional regulator [Phaeobacter gallaeciensis]MDE4122545.1 ROK family transcriptional regulator [Phaeobacter gallaeciensis]MDE4146813.1 ROK family transcriptional regulator [Phaeobacter gallaeciensis]
MFVRMDHVSIKERSAGVNQRGVRDHNERLILSILFRHRAVSAAEIARRTGLSRPTVSTILRRLEDDGFVQRGEPVKGKVGKPSIPIELGSEGALSVGMNLGRKSADLLLLDFAGNVRQQLRTTYDYPMPDAIFEFLKDGLETLLSGLTAKQQGRVCGIGIGRPFELWKWHDLTGPAAEEFQSWQDVDFATEVACFSDLPVFVVNDATAACQAEHMFGRGKEFRDYAYFFIGSFIGGGVAMNGTVFEGNRGNAGALGSMRTTGPLGESLQLIDTASLHLLEARLVEAGIGPGILWRKPQDWSGLERYVEAWIGTTAQELAKASLSICSVIDFEAIIIDGAFPVAVREELVERVRRYLANQDKRGLISPQIEAGVVGENARSIGAAGGPIFTQFLLDTNAGLAAL